MDHTETSFEQTLQYCSANIERHHRLAETEAVLTKLTEYSRKYLEFDKLFAVVALATGSSRHRVSEVAMRWPSLWGHRNIWESKS